jgi:hypothetical protein
MQGEFFWISSLVELVYDKSEWLILSGSDLFAVAATKHNEPGTKMLL